MKKTLKKIVWTYLASWVAGFILVLVQLLFRGQSFTEALSLYFTEIIGFRAYLVSQHLLFLVVLLLVYLFQYFLRVYKKKGRKILLKRLGLYLILPIALLVASFKTIVHFNTTETVTYEWNENHMNATGKAVETYKKDGLHRGMSVFGWNQDSNKAIADLIKANVEWVAVVPFIYQDEESSKEISSKRNDGNYTRRDSMFIKAINDLRKKGIHVHLKPHVWLGQGWRSNIAHGTKEDWDTWFGSYRLRMLHYAKMAQMTGTELFCIGTELRTSIKAQPQAWEALIRDVREIYDGELTYAANWYDEFEHVTFWDQLDYIGIQAYFPLTKTKNPDLETIKNGWQPHITMLSEYSQTHNKPILFTEVGYKSEASATIKPWEWGNAFEVLFKKKSDQTQLLAYEALFELLWHQDWFAGVYIWQWDTRSQQENAKTNLDFSPRFKPAENVIAKWFGASKAQSAENH